MKYTLTLKHDTGLVDIDITTDSVAKAIELVLKAENAPRRAIRRIKPHVKHLFTGDDGNLFDTRNPNWHKLPPLREGYSCTHRHIETVAHLKATLRAGEYAWPGGYPMYFITSDGGALSFDTVREELASIMDSIRNDIGDGWKVVGCDINYEDGDLTDDHTGKRIPSAYAED